MLNSYLTAGFLSMALAMTLPAAAQSSTTNTPQHTPSEAPAQATPSQSAPAQSTPGQPGTASEATPVHPQPQAQPAGENPLNLTDEQKAKLRPILQEENQQMEAVRNDTSMTQEQKMSKANEIRETAGPKIKAILTPEQLQKLAELQKAKQNQSAAPASTPHQ